MLISLLPISPKKAMYIFTTLKCGNARLLVGEKLIRCKFGLYYYFLRKFYKKNEQYEIATKFWKWSIFKLIKYLVIEKCLKWQPISLHLASMLRGCHGKVILIFLWGNVVVALVEVITKMLWACWVIVFKNDFLFLTTIFFFLKQKNKKNFKNYFLFSVFKSNVF